MFVNPEIAPDDLPRAAEVEWQPLSPSFRRMRLVVAGFVTVVVTLGLTALYVILSRALAGEDMPVPLWGIFLLIPVLAVTLIGWPFIAVPRMGYAVRDKDVLYRAGVFVQSVTAVPYNRLQHVEKDSTPLDRYFDIANLKLFTAGGAGGDLRIEGLSNTEAERLRAHLLERIGGIVEQ